MSKKEKPLPAPPGHRKFHEGEDNSPILADRIAEAMAEGKLKEFMEHEIPDSEQARALVSMMMGMTGLLPPEGLKDEGKSEKDASGSRPRKTVPPASEPPEDIRKAAHAGDMEKLVGLLKREHGKREDTGSGIGSEEQTAATIGKEDIDRLLRIASENGLSPDWIILRAVRVYIREYEKTGRL